MRVDYSVASDHVALILDLGVDGMEERALRRKDVRKLRRPKDGDGAWREEVINSSEANVKFQNIS